MDELYVLARRVLLDALEAVGAHRAAVVLVGAQAIYLRVGEADLAVAPFTTDGDLAIDPAILSEVPPLEQALTSAGFQPKAKDSVGVWITHRETSDRPSTEVAIDLLVPASISPGTGRRAARLPGHDPRAARIVNGLEGAVIDADVMQIAALDPASDTRAFEVRVAGPAALLVAKAHKIQERHGKPRSEDKDALDVLRLLRGTTTEALAARMGTLLGDRRAAAVTREGLRLLAQQFGRRSGIGIAMTVRAVGVLEDPQEITESCIVLTTALLRDIDP